MTSYAANTVMAAAASSAVGCNNEDGSGAGGGGAQSPQQHVSDSLGASSASVGDLAKLRRRRMGGNVATLALVVAVLALAVAVAK